MGILNPSCIPDVPSERIHYLDSAKGLAIALVVLAHICNDYNKVRDPLAIWINSFHLPLFFVVSGFLMAYKDETGYPWRKFLWLKSKAILYPYLSFSFLFLSYYIISQILRDRPFIWNSFSLIFDTVSLSGISTLWFLPSLFLAEAFIYMLICHQKNDDSSIPIFIVAVCAAFIVGRIANSHSFDTASGKLIYRVLHISSRTIMASGFVGFGYLFFIFISKHLNRMNFSKLFPLGILLTAANIPV